mmetsp:Transcript_27827/g.68435  ORF Transcript_27827/g.68435 Transcript_27827/m.68435 type:complete len:245 (-) Transcript_27827:15-749(-)
MYQPGQRVPRPHHHTLELHSLPTSGCPSLSLHFSSCRYARCTILYSLGAMPGTVSNSATASVYLPSAASSSPRASVALPRALASGSLSLYSRLLSHAGENGVRSSSPGDGGRVRDSVAHGKMNASPTVNSVLPTRMARRDVSTSFKDEPPSPSSPLLPPPPALPPLPLLPVPTLRALTASCRLAEGGCCWGDANARETRIAPPLPRTQALTRAAPGVDSSGDVVMDIVDVVVVVGRARWVLCVR